MFSNEEQAMPSEFTRIRIRKARINHNADCGHRIYPGDEYVYIIGRQKQDTLIEPGIDTLKMCRKCFTTPSNWWNNFGVLETCKPDFMVEIWNQKVAIGDNVYAFIGRKIFPTYTHTPAMIIEDTPVVGVILNKKIGPINLNLVVPQ